MTTKRLTANIITDFDVRIRYHVEDMWHRVDPVNLGETGLCVRLHRELDLDQQVFVRVRLGSESQPINVAARVKWVRLEDVHNIVYAGLEFDTMDAAHVERIQEYVDHGGEALMAFLSEFPLFREFSVEDCRSLLRALSVRKLERHEILFQEDQYELDLRGLFIVRSGLLSIYKGKRPCPERQLSVVSPGQVFGEVTLLTDQPHSATVMAVNDSEIIQLNKVGVRLIREEDPALALKIMDICAHALIARLGRTTRRLFAPIRLSSQPSH